MEYSSTIELIKNWFTHERERITLGYPQAAVLVLIMNKNGYANLVLTKRSSDLSKHSGQISFPGGKIDSGEDVYQTAIRETEEEIGVNIKNSDILGIFHDFSTPYYTSVTPVIAHIDYIPNYILSESEIDLIFEVPLSELLDESIHWTEIWERDGQEHEVHFYKWLNNSKQYIIWGATAGVINKFLKILK